MSVKKYCKKHQGNFGCMKKKTTHCCEDLNNALCLACSKGMSVKKYCKKRQGNFGCRSRKLSDMFNSGWRRTSIERRTNEDDDEPADDTIENVDKKYMPARGKSTAVTYKLMS